MANFIHDISATIDKLYDQEIGKSDIALTADEKIVAIGKSFSSHSTDAVYGKLENIVAEQIQATPNIVIEQYPNLYKSGTEYGEYLQTIRIIANGATKDNSYFPETDKVYDSFLRYKPNELIVKIFEGEDSFRLEYWKPVDQMWGCFKNAGVFGAFLNSIAQAQMDALAMRLQKVAKTCISYAIAYTLYRAQSNPKGTTLNILDQYKKENPNTTLTAADITAGKIPVDEKKPFYKSVVSSILNTVDRVESPNIVHNIDGMLEQTTTDRLNLVLLSPFANKISVDMESEVYHNDLVKLPNFTKTDSWQAIGEGERAYDPAIISSVQQRIYTDATQTATFDAEYKNILGIIYDTRSVGVRQERKSSDAFYNPDVRQVWTSDNYLGQYYFDSSRNFIVIYAKDEEAPSPTPGV